MHVHSDAHPAHRDRTRDRGIQDLLGIVRGIVMDSQVSDAEAVGLAQWLDAHPDVAAEWPGNVLHERLARIFADGTIDEEERAELRQLLLDTVGEDADATDYVAKATRLPLSDPPPAIRFRGQRYVFTGTFYFGTRRKCEQAIIERGGECGSGVTQATNYLVIGTLATGAWQFTSHGRKIQKAIEYRDAGVPIAIIAEEHWVAAMREEDSQP